MDDLWDSFKSAVMGTDPIDRDIPWLKWWLRAMLVFIVATLGLGIYSLGVVFR